MIDVVTTFYNSALQTCAKWISIRSYITKTPVTFVVYFGKSMISKLLLCWIIKLMHINSYYPQWLPCIYMIKLYHVAFGCWRILIISKVELFISRYCFNVYDSCCCDILKGDIVILIICWTIPDLSLTKYAGAFMVAPMINPYEPGMTKDERHIT